jgi:hypothetical protein
MTMPAGRYYIGDLCYVMHNEWHEVCDLFFPLDQVVRDVNGEFTLQDGRRFASFGTAYGDGTYQSNISTSHSVDSGSIGCIRVEDIRDDTYEDIERLGAIVEFDAPFEVSEHHGSIRFGHVHIETAGSYETEDYEYE